MARAGVPHGNPTWRSPKQCHANHGVMGDATRHSTVGRCNRNPKQVSSIIGNPQPVPLLLSHLHFRLVHVRQALPPNPPPPEPPRYVGATSCRIRSWEPNTAAVFLQPLYVSHAALRSPSSAKTCRSSIHPPRKKVGVRATSFHQHVLHSAPHRVRGGHTGPAACSRSTSPFPRSLHFLTIMAFPSIFLIKIPDMHTYTHRHTCWWVWNILTYEDSIWTQLEQENGMHQLVGLMVLWTVASCCDASTSRDDGRSSPWCTGNSAVSDTAFRVTTVSPHRRQLDDTHSLECAADSSPTQAQLGPEFPPPQTPPAP